MSRTAVPCGWLTHFSGACGLSSTLLNSLDVSPDLTCTINLCTDKEMDARGIQITCPRRYEEDKLTSWNTSLRMCCLEIYSESGEASR